MFAPAPSWLAPRRRELSVLEIGSWPCQLDALREISSRECNVYRIGVLARRIQWRHSAVNRECSA